MNFKINLLTAIADTVYSLAILGNPRPNAKIAATFARTKRLSKPWLKIFTFAVYSSILLLQITMPIAAICMKGEDCKPQGKYR